MKTRCRRYRSAGLPRSRSSGSSNTSATLDYPPTLTDREPPLITGLHHAQITIPEGREDDARRFYCDVLGVPEIPKPESLQGRGGIWLKAGDMPIHIGTESGVDRLATRAHLAYQVDDIGHWERVIREHGMQVEVGVPIPGFERFEFRDPFGNRVEMIQQVRLED